MSKKTSIAADCKRLLRSLAHLERRLFVIVETIVEQRLRAHVAAVEFAAFCRLAWINEDGGLLGNRVVALERGFALFFRSFLNAKMATMRKRPTKLTNLLSSSS